MIKKYCDFYTNKIDTKASYLVKETLEHKYPSGYTSSFPIENKFDMCRQCFEKLQTLGENSA